MLSDAGAKFVVDVAGRQLATQEHLGGAARVVPGASTCRSHFRQTDPFAKFMFVLDQSQFFPIAPIAASALAPIVGLIGIDQPSLIAFNHNPAEQILSFLSYNPIL